MDLGRVPCATSCPAPRAVVPRVCLVWTWRRLPRPSPLTFSTRRPLGSVGSTCAALAAAFLTGDAGCAHGVHGVRARAAPRLGARGVLGWVCADGRQLPVQRRRADGSCAADARRGGRLLISHTHTHTSFARARARARALSPLSLSLSLCVSLSRSRLVSLAWSLSLGAPLSPSPSPPSLPLLVFHVLFLIQKYEVYCNICGARAASLLVLRAVFFFVVVAP